MNAIRQLSRGLPRLIQQGMRSWALLSFNFHHLVTGLLLFCCLGGVFLVYQFGLTYLTGAILVLFGILIGSTTTSQAFATFIERAREFIEEEQIEDHTVDDQVTHTGLQQLDGVLETHMKQLLTLVELLQTMEVEKQKYVERYRTLTENLAASVVIRDAEGKISFCSPYTEVLTGYPLSEIYSAEEDFFIGIVHEDERESYRRSLAVSLAGEAFQCRYRFFHRAGQEQEMWAETRTVPIFDEAGDVVSTLSITLDVTGTVRYQRKVEEKNRELRDFTYMVSHDLKAPIFTIKGMITVLREDFRDQITEESAEVFTHIEEASTRLEALVESVLEYSRISEEGSTTEVVKLNDTFKDLRGDFAKQIEEADAKITIGELGSAKVDRLKTYQIFSNLLGNAIKYRDRSRPLEITITSEQSSNDRFIVVKVSDNGIGIPEERLEEIFRPFKRVPGTDAEGFGIGLACVRKLVEILHGTIEVESTLGEGSSFSVSLPRS